MAIRTLCALAVLLTACRRGEVADPRALLAASRALLRSGDTRQALARTEEALARTPLEKDADLHWRLRLQKAEILLANRLSADALRVLEPQPPGVPELQAQRLMYQGYAKCLGNRYGEASLLFAEARRTAAEPGPVFRAEIDLREGQMYGMQGQTAEAEAMFRRAAQAASEAGDAYLQAAASGNLGVLQLNAFRYDEALYWLQQSLETSRRIGAQLSAARAVGNMGWCHFKLGEFDRALQEFQAAYDRFAEAGNASEQQIWLGHIANIHFSRGNYAEAAAVYRRALEMARARKDNFWTSRWLRNLARTLVELRQWDEAERANNEALEIKRALRDTNSELYSLNDAARIAAGRKQAERAGELFRSVAAAKTDDGTPLVEAHAGLASLYIEQGQDQKAETEFRDTIAIVERQRAGLMKDDYKVSYLASLIRFYRDYVEFLMSRDRPVEALAVAESSRAKLLAEKLGASSLPRAESNTDFRALAKASGATLLGYWLGARRSFVWIVTGERITAVELPSEREIAALVEQHSGAVARLRDPLRERTAAGAKLYEMLLKPAAIPAGSKVVIVPDGCLHGLNFETIPVPVDGGERYWIELATVAIAPSFRLMRPKRAPGGRASLLLIGDPESPEQEYPKLRYAPAEMDAIEQALPDARRVVYRGASARPAVYRASAPRQFALIHFTAHAAANAERPFDSAVILSPERNNYRLLARDVVAEPVTAELVTVSACRSAGARAYSGEGMVGFAWAFLEAGARNVIAGLWNVEDKSTAQLMGQLYRGLARGLAPAEALREAKITLLHSEGPFRKPYYWAPFQLYTVKP